MAEGDHFVCSCKNHIMIPDDGATTDCRNTDLLLLSLMMILTAVIFVSIFTVQYTVVNSVCKCQCSTARSVKLSIVMFFHDLNIKSCRYKNLRSILQKFHKHINSKGHISGFQHCHLFACSFYRCQLLLRKACRTEYNRKFLLHTVVNQTVCRFCRCEINDHIRIHCTGLKIRKHRISVITAVHRINPRYNLNLRIVFDQTSDHLSHMAITAMHNCLYH